MLKVLQFKKGCAVAHKQCRKSVPGRFMGHQMGLMGYEKE